MNLAEYATYDALGLAELVAKKQVSPKELAETAAAAVDKIDGKVKSVVELYADRIEKLDERSLGSGPFRGVPFLIKDVFGHEQGRKIEFGSRLCAGMTVESGTYFADMFAAYEALPAALKAEVSSTGSPEHLLQPVRRGDFIIVDHQEMRRTGKARQRRLKSGIDRIAVALLRFDDAKAGKLSLRQKFDRDRSAFVPGGVVLDDDDGKSPIGPLRGKRLQRQAQMLRPAEARNANDDLDGRVERRRRCDHSATRRRLRGRNLLHGSFQASKPSHPRTDHLPASGRLRPKTVSAPAGQPACHRWTQNIAKPLQ